ncbi:hypothetical protein EX30DRAFT_307396 [Ascodesmis nigricans]|uniref:Uncharacterized protein n=1 Tax=Ascodesmis nigricans TaxID=341454 RepID=A0A4S2MVM9_9PEZI|nr:hypothetical protein EX30DRAFT_307396 [Ascodesmis nigricans]
MHHVLKWANTPGRTITISHDSNFGITMPLNVYEFIPTDEDQTQYWYRDYTSGWRSAHSVPYGLKRAISTDVLEKYIQDHTQHFIQTAFPGNPILSDLFTTAYNYSRADDHFLLRETLQMWTANQLLIQGASIHPGSDILNLLPITGNTPLNGHVPLPRVVSDQFDHLIERRIWQLEKQILAELQKRIFARKKEDWLKIFLTLIVLMNTLERDSWRLYYWMFHLNDGCTWPHATTPKELLQKDEMLAESLAAHFTAISKGITPFSLDWTREQTAALVGNIEGADAIVAAFERVGRGLRNPDHALHVTNVLSNYHAADEKSLDFLYTSKVMMV